MAILGELACISAAILALPATLVWFGRRKARQTGQSPTAAADGAISD
jgi:hypothetical protein